MVGTRNLEIKLFSLASLYKAVRGEKGLLKHKNVHLKEIFFGPTPNHSVIYRFIYIYILQQSWQLYACHKTHFHQLTCNKCKTVIGKTKNREAELKEKSAEVRSIERRHVYNIASVKEMKVKDVRSVYPEEALNEEAVLLPDRIRNKGVCKYVFLHPHTGQEQLFDPVSLTLCEFAHFKPVAFQKTL